MPGADLLLDLILNDLIVMVVFHMHTVSLKLPAPRPQGERSEP